MTITNIMKAIPHRGPMLLIDEIVEQSEKQIVCRKDFRGDEFFFQGHYPDQPIAPGVILCEAAMQAGAVLLADKANESSVSGVPVATRLNNVKFKRMVTPGNLVDFRVTLNEVVANAFFLSAKAYSDDKLVMSCDFACTLAERLHS